MKQMSRSRLGKREPPISLARRIPQPNTCHLKRPPQWLTHLHCLITDRGLYIDTCRILLGRNLTDTERHELERLTSQRIKKARRTPEYARKHGWSHVIQLEQPSLRVLWRLAEMMPQHKISRLHISLDLFVDRWPDALRIQSILKQHVVIRRFREQSIFVLNGKTVYFARRNASRNACMYSDRRSKIDGRPCCHLELRLQRAATLQRLGLSQLSTLNRKALVETFAREVRIFEFADSLAFRETVEAEIQRRLDEHRTVKFRTHQGKWQIGKGLFIANRHAVEASIRLDFCQALFGLVLGRDQMHPIPFDKCPVQNALASCRKLVGRNLIEFPTKEVLLMRNADNWNRLPPLE